MQWRWPAFCGMERGIRCLNNHLSGFDPVRSGAAQNNHLGVVLIMDVLCLDESDFSPEEEEENNAMFCRCASFKLMVPS